jgi:hypothetical protein
MIITTLSKAKVLQEVPEIFSIITVGRKCERKSFLSGVQVEGDYLRRK